MVGSIVRMTIGVATFLTVGVAVLGSIAARPSRWRDQGSEGGSGMTEGLDRWGVILFLSAVAFVVLLVVCLWPERPRWWLLLLPAAGFAWATWGAGAEWRALLDERALPRDYRLVIPVALPVSLVACALAASLTVLLVTLNTVDQRRRRRRS